MKLIQKISMDFAFHGIPPRVYGKQDDSQSRIVQIDLFNQGEAWPVPSDAVLMVRYRTPKGAIGLYDTLPDGSTPFEVSDNTVLVQLVDQIFTAAGAAECELRIISTGTGVSTWTFLVDVERGASGDETISSDYINVLTSLTVEANAAAKRAEEAAKRAEEASDPWEITTGTGEVSDYTSDLYSVGENTRIQWTKIGKVVCVRIYADVTYSGAALNGEYRIIQLSVKGVPKVINGAYNITSGYIIFKKTNGGTKSLGPWMIATYPSELSTEDTLNLSASIIPQESIGPDVVDKNFLINATAIGIASE